MIRLLVILVLLISPPVLAQEPESLPLLKSGVAPQDFQQMWNGFDPQAEPLDVQTLREWEEDGVVLRVVRFRIGVFKGKRSTLAAIYGFPKNAAPGGEKLPGLLQIHGGGQYADYRSCLMNAKRGYATVSIAWAGRILAPGYTVSPTGVQLFWDQQVADPAFKWTTDWGAVDGYHAPSRNAGNVFPSAAPHPWTMDSIESPRNSPWFLCALAARRALTFLERQHEVDPNRLGVYGHSMGGKLTVMASVDSRVKAAVPSCGGISDRVTASQIFQATICDNVSLEQISCPILFQSPANDFHGRIGDLPQSIKEIKSKQWRVICSPHHNHQDSSEYEVASLLWFDQHLQKTFRFPETPKTQLQLETIDAVPSVLVLADDSRTIQSVDVYYTLDGKEVELAADMANTVSRYWRQVKPVKVSGGWRARLPVESIAGPLWVYANVTYTLDQTVSGAGYYYGIYEADTFKVSSLIEKVSPEQMVAAGVKPTVESVVDSQLMIESFADGWQSQWFSYRPGSWPRSTFKLRSKNFQAPSEDAQLMLQVRCQQANALVVLLDQHAAVTELIGGDQWQDVVFRRDNFQSYADAPLSRLQGVRQLKLSDAEHLRGANSSELKVVGRVWQGPPPQFRNLRWLQKNPAEENECPWP